jgi:hypothetical protein
MKGQPEVRDKVRFNIHLPPALARRLKRYKAETDRTFCQVAIEAITAYLDGATRGERCVTEQAHSGPEES